MQNDQPQPDKESIGFSFLHPLFRLTEYAKLHDKNNIESIFDRLVWLLKALTAYLTPCHKLTHKSAGAGFEHCFSVLQLLNYGYFCIMTAVYKERSLNVHGYEKPI